MKNVTKALYPEVREQFGRYLRKARKTYSRTPNKSLVLFVLSDMTDRMNNIEFREGLETFFASLHLEIWRELSTNLWVKLGGKEHELEVPQICIIR